MILIYLHCCSLQARLLHCDYIGACQRTPVVKVKTRSACAVSETQGMFHTSSAFYFLYSHLLRLSGFRRVSLPPAGSLSARENVTTALATDDKQRENKFPATFFLFYIQFVMFYSQRKLVFLKCALLKSHSAVNFNCKWPFVVTNSPFKSCRKCQPVLRLSMEQFKMPNKIHMKKLQGIEKTKQKQKMH